jgi:hypothetical protein
MSCAFAFGVRTLNPSFCLETRMREINYQEQRATVKLGCLPVQLGMLCLTHQQLPCCHQNNFIEELVLGVGGQPEFRGRNVK